MGSEEGKVVILGAKDASKIVEELGGSFAAGKTRSYEWRRSQLKILIKVAEDHEQEIVDALTSDLSKPEFEAYIQEVHIFLPPFFFYYYSFTFYIYI